MAETDNEADRPKVLIVDDVRANLVAFKAVLSKLPVEPVTASSGHEALALLLRHEFAAILLDVQMPEMDGYETARLIGDHASEHPVPIIFITAFPERLLTGERPEPTYLIPKPFQENTVKAAIGQALFFHSPETSVAAE